MNGRADWLEDLAVHNVAMPDGLSTSEQLLFLKFRLLYQTAATGSITPEQGRREKIADLGQIPAGLLQRKMLASYAEDVEKHRGCRLRVRA